MSKVLTSPRSSTPVWVTDFGVHPVGDEWWDIRIAKSGLPDKRFKRGREMLAHFTKIQDAEYADAR